MGPQPSSTDMEVAWLWGGTQAGSWRSPGQVRETPGTGCGQESRSQVQPTSKQMVRGASCEPCVHVSVCAEICDGFPWIIVRSGLAHSAGRTAKGQRQVPVSLLSLRTCGVSLQTQKSTSTAEPVQGGSWQIPA